MKHPGVCMLLIGGFALASVATADPINSIFIDYSGTPAAPPLKYDFQGPPNGGELSVFIPSFTLEVQRTVGGVSVPEFISNASFSMTADLLTDVSSPPTATGVFASLNFFLHDAAHNLLLSGSNTSTAGLIYHETPVPNVMLLASSQIPVTGGSLASDFNIAAIVQGLGFLIDPGTGTFGALNVDHGGGVKISLNPVPEPASAVLWGLALASLCGGRRRRS